MKMPKMNKFWNMASVSDDEAEITLYGDVCSETPVDWWTGEALPGQYITPEGFLEDLQTVAGKKNVTVKLNSCGGDLYTGIAIHNALKGLNAKINMIVEGIAASAASVIMCAGDTVSVYPGSIVMIHGVSVGLMDYYNMQDLKQIQKSLEANEQAIAEIYSAKTGKDTDKLRSMITKECWMTGQEAIDEGFADVLLEGNGPEVSLNNKNVLFVNDIGHDMKGFKVPEKFQNKKVSTEGKPSDEIKKKEDKVMGIEELKAAYPDLINQIVNAAKTEATMQERERIKEIEEIQNNINDTKMLYEAKFGENPMTAEKLAFDAMKKNAVYAKAFIDNQKEDYNASNAAKVSGAPAPQDETPTHNADEIKQVVDLVNQMTAKGGK